MFYNNRVSIFSQGEDRQLTEIYSDIKAQVFRKVVKLDRSIAENTSKLVTMVVIDAYQNINGVKTKTLVKAGNIVQYVDEFGMTKKLKAAEPEFVKAHYFPNLIRLQCDLV